MYLCEDCFTYPGVAYIEGVVLCDMCFTAIFGVPWNAIVLAKYCPSCETKFAGQHTCTAPSVDAETVINNLKVKED